MKDKILITGGTSGLGKALALQYLAQGARVGIVDRTQADLAALTQAHPGLLTFQADIGDKNAIYPLAGAVESRLGSPDLLINAASTLGPTPMPLLMDTACEDLAAVLETNLIGPFRLIKALAPGMLLRGAGAVVNISSDAAINAYPGWGAYSVSKAALDHLTRIFAAELAEQGLHFLAVDPGDMATPMHFAAVPDADATQLKDPAEAAGALIRLIAESVQAHQAPNVEHVRRAL
ncbi:MAG: SDR family oxidoreductase [Candidatus Sericytochromatia bacterium]|nr:SDR family oxidoreductase [Candidatus Sericytochromatia bacterium]